MTIYLRVAALMNVTIVLCKMILMLSRGNESWHTAFRPTRAHLAKTETKG